MFIKIRVLIGLAALVMKMWRGGERTGHHMPLFTGRNDLTTISSWRLEIKALKTMYNGIAVLIKPIDDLKHFWFQRVFLALPLYNKTESVVFMKALKFTN